MLPQFKAVNFCQSRGEDYAKRVDCRCVECLKVVTLLRCTAHVS
jgi:hypothetical protein